MPPDDRREDLIEGVRGRVENRFNPFVRLFLKLLGGGLGVSPEWPERGGERDRDPFDSSSDLRRLSGVLGTKKKSSAVSFTSSLLCFSTMGFSGLIMVMGGPSSSFMTSGTDGGVSTITGSLLLEFSCASTEDGAFCERVASESEAVVMIDGENAPSLR